MMVYYIYKYLSCGLCALGFVNLCVIAHSLAHNKSSLAQLEPSGTRRLSVHGGPFAWLTWNVFLEGLSFTLDKQLSATYLLVPPLVGWGGESEKNAKPLY